MWSFAKIKLLRNDELTLLFTGVGSSCPSREFQMCLMAFNTIPKNKILAKIFEFTVYQ